LICSQTGVCLYVALFDFAVVDVPALNLWWSLVCPLSEMCVNLCKTKRQGGIGVLVEHKSDYPRRVIRKFSKKSLVRVS
jgi:hypothetical protein